MRQHIRRGAAAAVGLVAVGLLAVACATAPGLGAASPTGRVGIGGFSFQVPALPFRVGVPGSVPATQQTTAQSQATLQGATHSGEGCPIALPEQ